MRVIVLLSILVEIIRGVHSLKCHVNAQGAEPKETECTGTDNKFCAHVETMGSVVRACTGDKYQNFDVKDGCMKMEVPMAGETTMCFCNTDNCNAACTVDDGSCKEVEFQGATGPIKGHECKASCKSGTDGGGTGEEPKPEPGHTGKVDHTEKPDGEHTGKPNGEHTGKPDGEHTGKPDGEHTGKPDGEHTGKPADGEEKPSGNDTSGKPDGNNDGKTTKSGSQRNWESFQGSFASLIVAAIVTLIKIA